MKHRRGIELVRTNDAMSDDSALEHTFRVEVWTHPPEAAGELLETINRSTDFNVSNAAFREAIRQRPGKYLIHMNGRHRMLCELAPDPRVPLKPRPIKVGPDPYPEELNDPKWTFASLPEWQTLAIHCRSCDRVAPVDRGELARKHGKQTVITSLLPKLRCECGVKGDCEWKMGRLPR